MRLRYGIRKADSVSRGETQRPLHLAKQLPSNLSETRRRPFNQVKNGKIAPIATPLSSENGFYRQTLSADNNWTCEWTDLPLFIDGKAAEYSLREVKIGNTAYDGSADSEVGK